MILHVYANQSNIGDWLSALGIQALLERSDVVDLFCDRPFVPETLARIRESTSDDLIVIGGGGLFMDYFSDFWTQLIECPPSAPVFIWGVGLCDLKMEETRPPRALLQAVIGAASKCQVRDTLTRAYIGSANLGSPVPCPSIAAIAPAAPAWGLLHVDNYTTAGAAIFDRMDDQAQAYARSSARPYRRTNNRLEKVNREALDSILSLYRASDVILSSALHGCVIGIAMGRRVIAVSGDRKIEHFMAAMNLSEWVLDLAEVERVPELLARLEEQPFPEQEIAISVADNRRFAAEILASLRPPPERVPA